jgi:hypothetical protein
VLPVDGRLDVDDDPDEGGVAELVLLAADAGAVALGLAFFEGGGLVVEAWQGELAGLAAAFLLSVALLFAVADAVAVVVLVALLLVVAVLVALLLTEAVPVGEVLSLPEGLTLGLPLAGLLLEPSPELLLAGEVAEPAGGTLDGCVLLGLAGLAAVGDGQAVGCALLLWRAADVLAGPAPPLAEPAAVPEPSRLGAFPLALEDEIPTAEPSWTKASRSGGRARTTPMANTAQAAARTGLSSPSRQSRGRRAPPRAGSSPPRPVSQRPRPATKPPGAAARADPDRTRARIRSSPSGRGSTWSAAACSARRRYSPKSIGSGPCGGGPSNPDLVITLAPGPRAGRSCRGRCGS